MKRWLIFFSLFFVTGCSLGNKVIYFWEGRFLKVDTDISKKRWKLPKDAKMLAEVFYNLDIELDDISKELQSLSYSNFKQTAGAIVNSRPWVIGVCLIERRAGIFMKKGEFGRPFSISPDTIKNIFSSNEYSINFMVDNSNIFLVKQEPESEDNSYYIVILLDFKKLILNKCNLFFPFGVVAEHKVLFSNGVDKDMLCRIKWNKLLTKQISGRIKIGSTDLYWMSRYLGEKPIFYIRKL